MGSERMNSLDRCNPEQRDFLKGIVTWWKCIPGQVTTLLLLHWDEARVLLVQTRYSFVLV